MGGGDGGVWRTLLFLYSVVLAAAVCVPPVTILPLLLGFDSLLILLCAGCFGLLLTGGVVFLLLGRYDALVARSDQSGGSTASEAEYGGRETADDSMPGTR